MPHPTPSLVRALPGAKCAALPDFISPGTRAPRLLYREHFEDGADPYERVSAMKLEGVVSKRADAPYPSGRREAWIKVKCWKRERFVVVGFVPEGSAGCSSFASRGANRPD